MTGPFLRASCCHCHNCQKRTGSAFSVQGRVARSDFELLAGAELLRTFAPGPELRPKVFCSRCGSSLFSGDPLVDEEVSIRFGSLDGDPGIAPEVHVFAESAPVWEPSPC
ncbi:MAG TPA: GFA family protein [Solirubrobacterales bacterium]|nr:GFA family protein [Solirubrobacterales bacterium]